MTLDDLSTDFRNLDRAGLLEDWQWLTGHELLPILVTVVGNAFLQNSHDGTVHFLDTVEGTLELVAGSKEEFSSLLSSHEFVLERFSVDLIAPLIEQGLRPGPGRVLSFKTPPVLGGEYDAANLEAADIEVHFSVLGQIWAQVAELPEGAEIGQVAFRDKSRKRVLGSGV